MRTAASIFFVLSALVAVAGIFMTGAAGAQFIGSASAIQTTQIVLELRIFPLMQWFGGALACYTLARAFLAHAPPIAAKANQAMAQRPEPKSKSTLNDQMKTY